MGDRVTSPINQTNDDTQKKQLLSLRMSAMNSLAMREHSIDEIKQKLEQKFTSKQGDFAHLEQLIEQVLEQLIDDNLLNEARFARCFVHSRVNKGSGPVKIRHELIQRGISNDLINECLEVSYCFWQPYIKRVREKRFGSQQPDDYKEQSRQARFLYQRGFNGELIHQFFNDISTE